MLANMEQFADVSRARETYALFAAAMEKGRDILLRAGIAASPPPIPDFDPVFRRLDSGVRQTLFDELRRLDTFTTVDAIRIWRPLLRNAFAKPPDSSEGQSDGELR
jgi:hypothetical protein